MPCFSIDALLVQCRLDASLEMKHQQPHVKPGRTYPGEPGQSLLIILLSHMCCLLASVVLSIGGSSSNGRDGGSHDQGSWPLATCNHRDNDDSADHNHLGSGTQPMVDRVLIPFASR